MNDSFFLVDLNSSHEYKKTPETSEFRIINCLFLPEFLDESLKSAKSFQDITDNYFIKYGYGEFSEIVTDQIFHDDTGFVGKIFKNIQSEFDEKKLGYEDVIRNHLHTVIIHLLRHHTVKNQISDTNTVKIIKEYIQKNYMKSLQLSDICQKMNFSLSYISMKFRKETGLTFREYHIKIRIEKACHLLKSSNASIGNIAGTVGYTDPAFFYKIFRKEMGITPDEYRKKFANT